MTVIVVAIVTAIIDQTEVEETHKAATATIDAITVVNSVGVFSIRKGC